MMFVFEIRAKLTEIYQKYDFIIKTVLKFLLMFFAFSKISKVVGYNTSLSAKVLIIALSAFSAFLPPSLMVFAAVVYVFLQIPKSNPPHHSKLFHLMATHSLIYE